MLDFFATKVIPKYPGLMNDFRSPENHFIMDKAFKVINAYRRQFSDKNWRYTWFEWFWIVMYAQTFTAGRAAKMMLSLDGKEKRLSRVYIKDRVQPVMKFWEEFFCYSTIFLNLLQDS